MVSLGLVVSMVGLFKESTYNKMKYKPTNRGKTIIKKGPYEI
jgi:hypothetical protein